MGDGDTFSLARCLEVVRLRDSISMKTGFIISFNKTDD